MVHFTKSILMTLLVGFSPVEVEAKGRRKPVSRTKGTGLITSLATLAGYSQVGNAEPKTYFHQEVAHTPLLENGMMGPTTMSQFHSLPNMKQLALNDKTEPGFWEEQTKLSKMLVDEGSLLDNFHQFALKNNRDYVHSNGYGAAEGKETEYATRFAVFGENVRKAATRNMEGGGSVVHGITKFSDYTPQEFKKTFTGLKFGPDKDGNALPDEVDEMIASGEMSVWEGMSPASLFLAARPTLKASRNWADEGMTTPIKDQGQCGSCWAFSVVETLESSILQKQGKSFTGAPQELVSCDRKDHGCGGGNPVLGYKFLKSHGLESENAYPYMSGITKHSETCEIDQSKERYKVSDWKLVMGGDDAPDSDAPIKDWVLNHGPASIVVNANPWQTYKHGVLKREQCSTTPDHAVQIVGVDVDDLDEGTMTVRNSWGGDWGEDGFIRLEYGKNTCGIRTLVTSATAEQYSAGSVSKMKAPVDPTQQSSVVIEEIV